MKALKWLIYIVFGIIPTLPFTIYFIITKPGFHRVIGFELIIQNYLDWICETIKLDRL